MTIALPVMALCILLVYFSYFLRILQGHPQALEMEILKTLAEWMVHQGTATKGQLWGMWLLSMFLEFIYFLLTFQVLQNPIMLYFTAAFAGIEVYHFIKLGFSFKQFFSGKTKISQIFNWSTERFSVTLFFTHAMLVLISLAFFSN